MTTGAVPLAVFVMVTLASVMVSCSESAAATPSATGLPSYEVTRQVPLKGLSSRRVAIHEASPAVTVIRGVAGTLQSIDPANLMSPSVKPTEDPSYERVSGFTAGSVAVTARAVASFWSLKAMMWLASPARTGMKGQRPTRDLGRRVAVHS